MAPSKHHPPGQGPAGTTQWGPDRALLAVATALAAAGLAYLLLPAEPDTPEPPPAPQAGAAANPATPDNASGASVWSLQASVPTASAATGARAATDPGDGKDPTRDLSHYVPAGAKPSMQEVIGHLHAQGDYTGLGAFNPPGTRPPKVGLAVPEDYPLPPGYVRHYQATDDGQRIEPILMFAPDFQLRDAQQRAIDMPKNRVVPAELAPPGFPIRLIVIPPALAQAQ